MCVCLHLSFITLDLKMFISVSIWTVDSIAVFNCLLLSLLKLSPLRKSKWDNSITLKRRETRKQYRKRNNASLSISYVVKSSMQRNECTQNECNYYIKWKLKGLVFTVCLFHYSVACVCVCRGERQIQWEWNNETTI